MQPPKKHHLDCLLNEAAANEAPYAPSLERKPNGDNAEGDNSAYFGCCHTAEIQLLLEQDSLQETYGHDHKGGGQCDEHRLYGRVMIESGN